VVSATCEALTIGKEVHILSKAESAVNTDKTDNQYTALPVTVVARRQSERTVITTAAGLPIDVYGFPHCCLKHLELTDFVL